MLYLVVSVFLSALVIIFVSLYNCIKHVSCNWMTQVTHTGVYADIGLLLVCECVRGSESKRQCVWERERERERVRTSVCVREGARESESVCVPVCERVCVCECVPGIDWNGGIFVLKSNTILAWITADTEGTMILYSSWSVLCYRVSSGWYHRVQAQPGQECHCAGHCEEPWMGR